MDFPTSIPELQPDSPWLASFPEEARSKIELYLAEGSPNVLCAGVDGELSQFKLNARSCLDRIESKILQLSESVPPQSRVIWCLENLETRGLEDFEALAVFGLWLDIDFIAQTGRGSALSRIILAGCLRETNLGLWFRLALPRGRGSILSWISLAMIRASGMPIAAVAMGLEEAQKLSLPSGRALVSMLRHLILKDSIGIALFVSHSQLQSAFCDLQAETDRLRQLLGVSCPIRHVCFESPIPTNLPGLVNDAMRRANLCVDSSLPATQTVEQNSERNVLPFLGGGAYQCQPFDIRIPAGLWGRDNFMELPRVPLEDVHKIVGQSCTNGWRRQSSLGELAQLLDWGRMEKYHQNDGESLLHARLYDHYRIYNWPPPDVSPRTVLVDCGTLNHPIRALGAIRKIARLRRAVGSRGRILGAAALYSSAQAEAAERVSSSIQAVLDQQVHGHEYLSSAQTSSMLRQDVRDFLEFLPRKLGRTMEIGSGTGQLAAELAARSTFFLCLDLYVRTGKRVDSQILFETAADVHNLPCVGNAFDSVIANNSLEHLYDPLRCLQEVHRVLRPQGSLYALIPLDALHPEYDLWAHLWKADTESIANAFAAAGFEMVRCEVVDIYTLGVAGCFPSCNGMVCKVEARKRDI